MEKNPLGASRVTRHIRADPLKAKDGTSYLIASTAYSLPNTPDPDLPLEGSKIRRNEPLVLTFNIGWIDGAVLPGMVGGPILGVKNHNIAPISRATIR
ncbi:uncharacterized protein Z518_01772 [Rhinocladiella mackenziei CBS 650.93]|uniref:Rhinocladiella mackenziei CBS 650.93 unplaced genomic scaffold supercont1.1, whole genome shotgun sequence n=1 Tax=Rhinocladiella mackenziei CBS 650.93 TaxID=1442369 RepID=A0A0D2HJ45_9EURO|nr:uncharacterized protein Z518_01772 [Rhinocladiella mackenziei CBS 650.93]KIX10688.1 hypothetical protein Z518_01772 [Rhinocladiella mackenziei CBS 650.93]